VAQGLLDARPLYYWFKSAVAAGTLLLAGAAALITDDPVARLACAVLLGFAMTQIGLLAHDVCHRQAFRGGRANHAARVTLGCLFLGISHSWWTGSHNEHHAAPNQADRDPDIRFPMIAFTPKQAEGIAPWLRPLLPLQAFVYFALFPLQAVNMRGQSVSHLIKDRPADLPLQVLALAAHFAVYGWLLFALGSWPMALAFFVVHQGTFGLYNGSVFASNHKGMEMFEDSPGHLDFLRQQVLTSRGVHGGAFTDFWCGGLNYQIEHHLFPSMARPYLRKVQPLVASYCAAAGVPYTQMTLWQSYGVIIRYLNSVGLRGRDPFLCPLVAQRRAL
jgi:fatty acid desaturase